MGNFKDIINLVENDDGKIFVVDEAGDVKLVMLKVEHYQKLLLEKLGGKLRQSTRDIEEINKEITKAQLSDDVSVADLPEGVPAPQASNGHKRVDLRSEVIDPNFNFDAPPGEEYESIKPEFEDI